MLYEDYLEMCSALVLEPLDINDNWLGHYNYLESQVDSLID